MSPVPVFYHWCRVIENWWSGVDNTSIIICTLFIILSSWYLLSFQQNYTTNDTIPVKALNNYEKILAFVVKISDGDGLRVVHISKRRHRLLYQLATSLFGYTWGIRLIERWFAYTISPKSISTTSLSIRLSGVDAPESASFGMPEQPFAAEAKQFLVDNVDKRFVELVLLKKDHYGRIIASAFYRKPVFRSTILELIISTATCLFPPFHSLTYETKNLSLELVEQGLAVIYTGSLAVYGPLSLSSSNPYTPKTRDKHEFTTKRFLEKTEQKAQKCKKGMWIQVKNSSNKTKLSVVGWALSFIGVSTSNSGKSFNSYDEINPRRHRQKYLQL